MPITKEDLLKDPEFRKEFLKPKKVGLIISILKKNIGLLKEFGLEIKVFSKGEELKTS